MRSRPYVVITRLNDEEFKVFQEILAFGEREMGYGENKSQKFRKVLKVIDEMLKNRREYLWWEKVEIG